MLLRWLYDVRKRLMPWRQKTPGRPGRRRPVPRLVLEVLEDRSLLSTVSWINPSGGDWSVGSNWSSGSTPGVNDDVVINQPATAVITHALSLTDTIHSLTNSGNLTLSAGTLNVETVQNTGTISIGSGSMLAVNNFNQTAGTTQLQGGTLGSFLPPENNSLSFAGQNFVQVPSTPSLNPTSQITVEAWINPSSLSNPLQGIAGNWNDLTGNNRTNLLWLQSNHAAFYVSHTGSDFPSVLSTTTVQTNHWYFVTGTFDGTYLNMYVNGVLEATQYSPGTIDTNNLPFYIGRVDGGGSGPKDFDGQIADVRLWNVARSSSEIQSDMTEAAPTSATGLAGDWQLAQGGSTVVDLSGSQNDGSLSSPPPSLAPVNGGTVMIQGGILTGSGTINGDLTNGGELDLGSAPGVLTVRGSYTQTTTGTLTLKIGGTAADPQADELNVLRNATLAGTLNLSLLNGFAPTAGQTFDVLNAATTSGNFATTNIPVSDGVPAFTPTASSTGFDIVGATVAPTSTVNPLPAYSSPSFTVSWSGQDNPGGSGIAGFDIFVSDNGSPYTAFLTNTLTTSATFTGQRGHTYSFYSVSTDGVGNREATPAAAEATTTVPLQVSTTTNLTSNSSAGSTYGQSVIFTATVSANLSVFGTPTGSVQFLADGVNLGGPVTLSSGTASVATATLSAGQHTVTAIYTSNTSDFAGSGANPLLQTVTPAALTVTADNKTKVYGAAVPSLTGIVVGLQNNDVVTATFSTLATAASAVGTYAITASLNDPGNKLGNYTVTIQPGTLTVTQAVLTVAADNKTMTSGSPVPTLTAHLTGFVNGDTANVVSGSPSLSTTATNTSPGGTYPITVGQGTLLAANYTFSFVNGSLTVMPATVSTTKTTVGSSTVSSVFGQTVTFLATISATSGTGIPTGTVTFMDGTKILGTGTLLNGKANITTAALDRGNHAISAVYKGDAHDLGSTSTILTQTVGTIVLEPDPLNPQRTALFVSGTAGNDLITITSDNHGQVLHLRVHDVGPGHFDFTIDVQTSSIDRVVIIGGGGIDVLFLSEKVPVPVVVFGGSNTYLKENPGLNLIGPKTIGDVNLATMASLLAEWTRIDQDDALRWVHLLNPKGNVNTVDLDAFFAGFRGQESGKT
jgi:Concanavalin A-like lectin/glucanases superfamily/Bacterial Ig-like domain (group 3)/MBG domain (YGX type)